MKGKIYFILLLLITIVSCKNDDSGSATIYQDDLSVDKKTWFSDSTKTHVRKFQQGHYSIREDSIGRFAYSPAPYATLNFPYSVQIDGIIQVEDPNQFGYIGIIFNYTDSNHYSVFQISNNGKYFIWTYNNGSYTTIAPSTLCSYFLTGKGAKNTLKLTQHSTTIEVQINNVGIGSFQVIMASGNMEVGVLAGNVSGVYFSPTTGLFNNFILTKIKI